MPNPLTLLFQPARLVALCLGMLVGYGAMLAGFGTPGPSCDDDEQTDVLRVELLR